MLNNNVNVDYAEEVIDDDSLFNTNFVDKSLAIADNFSKSLNDIYSETIPQNGIRPNSFAFQSDVFLFSVSISFDHGMSVDHGWRKSSSGRFDDDLRKYFMLDVCRRKFQAIGLFLCPLLIDHHQPAHDTISLLTPFAIVKNIFST